MQTEPRQQGEFESIYRDLIIAYENWEFAPMDVENPFPKNNGSVHLWMGDDFGALKILDWCSMILDFFFDKYEQIWYIILISVPVLMVH